MLKTGWILLLQSWFLTVVLSLSNEPTQSCRTDDECSESIGVIHRIQELQEMFRHCVNRKCTCPQNHTSIVASVDIGRGMIDLCVPSMHDTGKPCGKNSNATSSDCESTGKCSSNNTCLRCYFGRPSDSNGECEGPLHGDICSKVVEKKPYKSGRFLHTKKCKGEGQHCDYLHSQACVCRDGLFYSKGEEMCKPLPEIGEDCTDSKRCKDDPDSFGFTRCSDSNTCICKGLVSTGTSYCLQSLKGKCGYFHHCPEDAHCKDGKCQCAEGFVDGRKGECLHFLYGQKSVSNPESKILKALQHQGLICINGQYSCENPVEQYYDEGPEGQWHWSDHRHICVVKVGGFCWAKNDTRCTEGATCVNNKGEFTCKCLPGFSTTPENKCFEHVQFNQACDDVDRKCDHYAGLICIKGVCNCPSKRMKFDTDWKKCVSPKGYFCGKTHIGKGESVEIECESGLNCRIPKGPILSGPVCLP